MLVDRQKKQRQVTCKLSRLVEGMTQSKLFITGAHCTKEDLEVTC